MSQFYQIFLHIYIHSVVEIPGTRKMGAFNVSLNFNWCKVRRKRCAFIFNFTLVLNLKCNFMKMFTHQKFIKRKICCEIPSLRLNGISIELSIRNHTNLLFLQYTQSMSTQRMWKGYKNSGISARNNRLAFDSWVDRWLTQTRLDRNWINWSVRFVSYSKVYVELINAIYKRKI